MWPARCTRSLQRASRHKSPGPVHRTVSYTHLDVYKRQVYAPIANRLGILNVKEELEDRSLHYLDPVGYEEISRMLSELSLIHI